MIPMKRNGWGTVVLGALCIMVIVSFARVYFKDYELRREIQRVRRDVSTLEKRKIESLDLLQRLQSDAYIEERARVELQQGRAGQAVLVVPGQVVSSTDAQRLTPTSVKRELSNLEKWWYYFFRPHTGSN